MSRAPMQHPIVSREEWLIARATLLAREKAVMKAQDGLVAEQRALPWVAIKEDYVFEGPEGTLTFAELFDRRSQLFVHHFMLSPDDLGLCVGCSQRLLQGRGRPDLPHVVDFRAWRRGLHGHLPLHRRDPEGPLPGRRAVPCSGRLGATAHRVRQRGVRRP